MDAGRRAKLEETTRYDPAEVERRVFAGWLGGRATSTRGRGYGRGELLDRDPAAERHRRAAHGPRAQRHDPGRPRPHAADAGPQDDVDPRHRPRRDRHPGGGREGAGSGGRRPPRARPRGLRRARLGVAEQYGGRIIEQFKRLGASCDYERERFTLDEGYVARRLPRLRRPLREGPASTATTTWSTGTRARSRRSATSRSRTARSRTRSTDRLSARGADGSLTVATVRPETMLADTAVAVNPDDERYRDLVGQHVHPAAGRPADADHRRRARRRRVRHRRAEDHARPRPERLRDRSQARPRGDLGDRRGRPHDRRRRRPFAGLTSPRPASRRRRPATTGR